jgi:hypothetical protein
MASSLSLDCPRIDDTFGPHAGDCRGGFDFTLLFEESILTIAPLGLLLLVLPWRIFYLFSKPIKVVWNPLIYLKTVRCISRSPFPCDEDSRVSLPLESSLLTCLSSLEVFLPRFCRSTIGAIGPLGRTVGHQNPSVNPGSGPHVSWLSCLLSLVLCGAYALRSAFRHPHCLPVLLSSFRRRTYEDAVVAAV